MSNKDAIARVFAGLAEGDGAPLIQLLAEDVSWTIIGTTSWSGTLTGRQNVLAGLAAPLAAQLLNFTLVAQRIIAEGDTVVVQAQGHSQTHTGKDYNNTYCFFFQISGGAIQQVTEYLDTALVNATLDPPQR